MGILPDSEELEECLCFIFDLSLRIFFVDGDNLFLLCAGLYALPLL